MTSRSRRGRWQRVLTARRQAGAALGRDPIGGDPYFGPPKRRSTAQPDLPVAPPVPYGPGVRVLFVGEAATRLGISRAELDAMIARGAVKTLPIEFGVIPTSEVEGLKAQ